jgi:hypothetical protein
VRHEVAVRTLAKAADIDDRGDMRWRTGHGGGPKAEVARADPGSLRDVSRSNSGCSLSRLRDGAEQGQNLSLCIQASR